MPNLDDLGFPKGKDIRGDPYLRNKIKKIYIG